MKNLDRIQPELLLSEDDFFGEKANVETTGIHSTSICLTEELQAAIKRKDFDDISESIQKTMLNLFFLESVAHIFLEMLAKEMAKNSSRDS